VARLHEEAYKDPIQKVLEAFEQCDEEQRSESLYLHLYHHEAAPKCLMGHSSTDVASHLVYLLSELAESTLDANEATRPRVH
jgi:hypothetical protein